MAMLSCADRGVHPSTFRVLVFVCVRMRVRFIFVNEHSNSYTRSRMHERNEQHDCPIPNGFRLRLIQCFDLLLLHRNERDTSHIATYTCTYAYMRHQCENTLWTASGSGSVHICVLVVYLYRFVLVRASSYYIVVHVLCMYVYSIWSL